MQKSILRFHLLWLGMALWAGLPSVGAETVHPIAAIDFHRNFLARQAERFFDKDDFVAAHKAFSNLAKSASEPIDRAMWEARASVARGRQEGRFDDGMRMARAIDDRPYSILARMELMRSAGDFAGLADAFGNENIGAWPERPIRIDADAGALALYYRGQAYHETGNDLAAVRDLDGAVEGAGTRARKLDILYLHRSLRENAAGEPLHDPEKLFQINVQMADLGGACWRNLYGIIGASRYLRDQGSYEDALAMIDRMKPLVKPGMVYFGIHRLDRARILSALGRYDEALESLQEVVESNPMRERHPDKIMQAKLLTAKVRIDAGDLDAGRAAYRRLATDETIPERYRDQAREAVDQLTHP